jgi:hypothetical protein
MIKGATSSRIFVQLWAPIHINAKRNTLVALDRFTQGVASAVVFAWLSNDYAAWAHFKDLVFKSITFSGYSVHARVRKGAFVARPTLFTCFCHSGSKNIQAVVPLFRPNLG